MKLLKGLKLPKKSTSVNLILRDAGRNFSDLRDAHVRQLLLLQLKEQPKNAFFQEIFKQLETLNLSDIRTTEHSMLVEQNDFKTLQGIWRNNKIIDSYFALTHPDPLKVLDVFSSSYLKSFKAFNSSIQSLDPDLLHEWRKRLKDTQHQFELLYDSMPGEIQDHYTKIQDLCNVLGELNDWEMMNRWITNIQAELTNDGNVSSMLLEEIMVQQETLLGVAKAHGHDLYTFTPEQFKDQLFCQLE